MKFLAKLQHMAASEIMNNIPHEIYQEIKERDPTPVFRAYAIGHEGEATGKQVGVGTVIKNWFSSAVKKIVSALQFGTKVFHGHNIDSSHEGRKPIGEIVGKAVSTIKDKLNAIAITYIYPEYRNLPLDVASIEADINIDPTRDSVEAIDVKGVTGLALGSSVIEKPGFADASLLSQIQAFANGRLQFKEGDKMPTLEEIKTFVSEEGISPSEIFGRDALIDDPVVMGYVKAEVKEKTTSEYHARKRNLSEFEEEKKKMDEEKKKLEDRVKELMAESAKIKAADLFSNKAKERKLDKKEISFIESKRTAEKGGFEPEDPENLDKEVDRFMDDAIVEYKKTAKLFGVKIEEKEDEEEVKGGGEPGEGGSGESENELIPD